MTVLNSVTIGLTYVCKGIQIACDATDLATGTIECLETPAGGNKPVEKVFAGAIRMIFSVAEVGAKAGNASNHTMSTMKGVESIAMTSLVAPAEIMTALKDYSTGNISGPTLVTKIVAPIASSARAAIEGSIYTEQHYLGLTPEERENQYRLIPKPGTDPEYPEYEKVPIVIEECERNLENSQKAQLPLAMTEIALRTGMISSAIDNTIDLYKRFANELWVRSHVPPIHIPFATAPSTL